MMESESKEPVLLARLPEMYSKHRESNVYRKIQAFLCYGREVTCPRGDVILAHLAYPLNDVTLYLHQE
jgi:hypothetical protein